MLWNKSRERKCNVQNILRFGGKETNAKLKVYYRTKIKRLNKIQQIMLM